MTDPMRDPPRRLSGLAAALSLAFALLFGAGGAGAADRAALTRIAFGSCADQNKPQPIWDAILTYRPDLFIFAGDNVYGDVTGADMAELKSAYERARVIPGHARLRAEVPRILATWDDHDYGQNDGGADFLHKRAAQRLFADFWNLAPDDARRTRDGIYAAASYGEGDRRIQVILLDTRFFRSPLRPTDQRGAPGRERYLPDPDPAKTMLGAAQWQWLEERLREPAALRLIVSSIQVLADGHGWERWGNLPAEREKLFEAIGRTGANGIVFLSGDRHFGGIYRRAADLPYPVHEVTSSGLNLAYAGVREVDDARIGAPYDAPNFGTIDVDWGAERAVMAIRAVDGAIVRQAEIRLPDLRRPR
jgi:alkaline phosphatase D